MKRETMDDAALIRSLETLNKQLLQLVNSPEYTHGIHSRNIRRALSDLRPEALREHFRAWRQARAFARVPRHEQLPNLTDQAWEASLKPGDPTKRVVVYSCITGGYDLPHEPLFLRQHIDYMLFTSDPTIGVGAWQIRTIPDAISSGRSNAEINRYIKFHPHELFADTYDAAIYIDGNIQPISDMSYYADIIQAQAGIALHQHRVRDNLQDEVAACKALGKGDSTKMDLQLTRYLDEGYPLAYGLLECNVIASDLHNPLSKAIFDAWWEEFNRAGSGRDQLSLPYVLWKQGIPFNSVATMGRNAYCDTKLYIHAHQ